MHHEAEPAENSPAPSPAGGGSSSPWTFLTNHAHVLVCLAREPDARLRDVAVDVGITERAVHRLVADLEAAGVLSRVRDGRRNHYVIHADKKLRHPVEAHCTVHALLGVVGRAEK